MYVPVLETGDAVASALAERVASMLRARPDAVLGLASGRTPVDGYAEMQRLHAAGQMDGSRASTFNLDELAGIDGGPPGSSRTVMEDHLCAAWNFPPGRMTLLA